MSVGEVFSKHGPLGRLACGRASRGPASLLDLSLVCWSSCGLGLVDSLGSCSVVVGLVGPFFGLGLFDGLGEWLSCGPGLTSGPRALEGPPDTSLARGGGRGPAFPRIGAGRGSPECVRVLVELTPGVLGGSEEDAGDYAGVGGTDTAVLGSARGWPGSPTDGECGDASLEPCGPRVGVARLSSKVPATRKSARLAHQSTGAVLEKVIMRKTVLREDLTPTGAGGARARAHRRGRGSSDTSKTKRLGRKCGIILTDAEVHCFRAFVDASM